MFGEVEYDTYRGDYTIKPKCISTVQMIEKRIITPKSALSFIFTQICHRWTV